MPLTTLLRPLCEARPEKTFSKSCLDVKQKQMRHPQISQLKLSDRTCPSLKMAALYSRLGLEAS